MRRCADGTGRVRPVYQRHQTRIRETTTMARRRLAGITGTALLLGWLMSAVVAGPASAGGGCHAQLERDASESTVRLTGSCYDPMIARVPAGATVRFVNTDDVVHVVVGAAGTWGTFEELDGGESVAYRFTEDGVYPYACYLHPTMIGAVVVGDGGPGGGGATVLRVAAGASAATTPPPATPAPTAESTEAPASAAAAAPIAPASAPPAEPAASVSPLTIGLLVVLVAVAAAYVLGLIPGVTRPRTRSR
jgi:plastocyanin